MNLRQIIPSHKACAKVFILYGIIFLMNINQEFVVQIINFHFEHIKTFQICINNLKNENKKVIFLLLLKINFSSKTAKLTNLITSLSLFY